MVCKQQITPDRYKELIGDLVIRADRVAGFLDSIESLRVRIDEIDNQVLTLLGFLLIKKISFFDESPLSLFFKKRFFNKIKAVFSHKIASKCL